MEPGPGSARPAPPVAARVLWVAKGLGRGGIEQFLARAVRHIDRARFEVEVLYLLPWKDDLVPDLEAQDIPVHCVPSVAPLDLRWLWGAHKLVRVGRFDIVHSHMPYPAVGVRLVCGGRRTALVHTEHNVWPRYRRPTFWANAATYGRNRAVIAVSDAVARSIRPPRCLAGLRLPPVEIVHHGIEPGTVERGPAARSLARAQLGLTDGELVIGSVGSLTFKKDHQMLLEATSELAGRYPGLRLLLIGSGPLESQLRDEVSRRALGDCVRLLGSRDDVARLLPALDVFVVSSRYEGLPLALVEAMAAGLPSVATRVGGIPEVLVNGSTGFIVPPGDAAAMAAAVDELLADEALRSRMGWQAAVESARWNVAAAMAQTQAVYDRVLARPS